ncbi:energy transducer TonB [Dysgonomonas sp. 511]|uniref:TonB family protein n=1 Tax=Dysgonomonas sp. 511 TaxID=2302930 RepID=UPI0013D470FD|nr:energy transducer TonB [Dysgonomonas sp. 511]NDV79091.1 energy transducer TonB [Dysgonomonas sp. 511]
MRITVLAIFLLLATGGLFADDGISIKIYKQDRSTNDIRIVDNDETKTFVQHLKDIINYPSLLIQIEMEGEVDLQFDVNDQKKASNIKILKGFDPLADEQVVSAVQLAACKIPQNSDQAFSYYLQVSFALNDALKQQQKDGTLKEKDRICLCQEEHMAEKAETKLAPDSQNRDPQYPGGQEALDAYLKANLKYPKLAIEYGIEGRVVYNITVMPDGEITNIRLFKGVFRDCNEEAFYLIKKMPKWIPGTKDGKPVAMNVVLPIPFELPK